jgi:hypothetical protein
MPTAPLAPDAVAPCFTVEQANRMLPLVRRIVADLVADYRRWKDAVDAFELHATTARADDQRLTARQQEIQRLAADIEHYLGELTALGVECKGLEDGLVDFPGEIDGERACLCWKLGEPAVEWWHRPDAGFAGRRPLVPNASGLSEATR